MLSASGGFATLTGDSALGLAGGSVPRPPLWPCAPCLPCLVAGAPNQGRLLPPMPHNCFLVFSGGQLCLPGVETLNPDKSSTEYMVSYCLVSVC